MKIVGHLLFAAAAVGAALSVAAAGCSSTSNYNDGASTSHLGQSCQRTYDCASGLVCLANVCFAEAPVADSGVVGEGGVVVTGPHLGHVNESCQTSNDCQSPLACINQSCTNVSYNLTATGKSCSGECNAPADCCELPVGYGQYFQPWYTGLDGGFPIYHQALSSSSIRCEDILGFLGGDANVCNDTALTTNQLGLAEGCFAYKTYCQCAANTWACNANVCSYTATCTTSSATVGGCPTETRGGRGLSSACNLGSGPTGSCQAGCAAAADCAGKYPAGSGHACGIPDGGGTNCTCYQSACYFKCSKDLDCASGSTCDMATSLCKAAGCQTNADCVQSLGNAQAQCVAGACAVACSNDGECHPPSTICSAGFCKASGCTSDANCTGSTHLFCVPATATTFTSAVTN